MHDYASYGYASLVDLYDYISFYLDDYMYMFITLYMSILCWVEVVLLSVVTKKPWSIPDMSCGPGRACQNHT